MIVVYATCTCVKSYVEQYCCVGGGVLVYCKAGNFGELFDLVILVNFTKVVKFKIANLCLTHVRL